MNQNSSFNKYFSFTAFAFFAISIPFLVTEKYLAKALTDISMLLALVYCITSKNHRLISSQTIETFIKLTLLIFISILIYGYIQQHEIDSRLGDKLENYSRMLIPILLVPILSQVSKYYNLSNITITGILVIASVVILITLSWDAYTQLPRGRRLHGHPIDYGNLCIVMGLSMMGIISYFSDYRKKIFLCMLGLIGITASLYSGSRGGWITLVSTPLIWLYAYPTKKIKLLIILFYLTIALLFTSFYLFNSSIQDRINATIYNVFSYFDNDTAINEISAMHQRILLWKIAFQAFLENPIAGIGIGEYYAFKKHFILSQEASHGLKSILKYKHAHSDYFTIMACTGILGIIAYSYLFYFLINTFRANLKSLNIEVKTAALTGLLTIVCYLDFALTESFLHSKLGSYFFYFMITLLLFIIQHHKVPIGGKSTTG